VIPGCGTAAHPLPGVPVELAVEAPSPALGELSAFVIRAIPILYDGRSDTTSQQERRW